MARHIQFRHMLAERQKKTQSLLCVGLDPLLEKLPQGVAIEEHMTQIIDATAEHACMFKPQRAYYEALPDGIEILQNIISHIHSTYPDIPVFLDCKRGDIDRTQRRYRDAHFELDGADGINFNPYMGKTCMQELVHTEYLGRAIVGLCYTSNSDAREVQNIKLQSGEMLWERIAALTLQWAQEAGITQNAGLVMAAAYEEPKGSGIVYAQHLIRCREIVGDTLWFLIPGVGTQRGYVEETVRAAYAGHGSIAINSSSVITFASQGADFAHAAATEAQRLKEQMQNALKSISVL